MYEALRFRNKVLRAPCAAQMMGDLLDTPDLRLMSVLMGGALATVPSQKHIAFITTTLYACKDWMLLNPKFCEGLLQVSACLVQPHACCKMAARAQVHHGNAHSGVAQCL